MNDHGDWEADSLVECQKLMAFAPKPSVDQIVVLGERHSGAEWLVEKLSAVAVFPTHKDEMGLPKVISLTGNIRYQLIHVLTSKHP